MARFPDTRPPHHPPNATRPDRAQAGPQDTRRRQAPHHASARTGNHRTQQRHDPHTFHDERSGPLPQKRGTANTAAPSRTHQLYPPEGYEGSNRSKRPAPTAKDQRQSKPTPQPTRGASSPAPAAKDQHSHTHTPTTSGPPHKGGDPSTRGDTHTRTHNNKANPTRTRRQTTPSPTALRAMLLPVNQRKSTMFLRRFFDGGGCPLKIPTFTPKLPMSPK
jgi:hypothetical protein